LNPPLPDREKERYTFETRGTGAEKGDDDMAVSRQMDLLEPIDYWTNKAQIPTKGKKQRIYDIDALETVMLIKQAKDKGLNLGAAIDAARRFRERAAENPAAENLPAPPA